MITLEKLPEQTSMLKYVEYEIIDKTGKTIKLPKEYVPTFECFFKRHRLSVFGSILYIDRLDISKQIDLKTSSIKIYYMDLFNYTFFRTFKIINIDEFKSSNGINMYEFKLRDEISYFLDNLYISKSFSVSRTAAIKQIFTEYNLISKLSSTKLKFLTEDDNIVGNLVINKNFSVLDFFEREFHRIGYAFYQDKLGLYIKNKDNLLPGKIPELSGAFSERITNQYYKNKIYEIITNVTNKEEIDKEPKQQSFYYDIDKREILSIDVNIDTLQNEITLNKNNENIQETVGYKAKFQNRSDAAQQKSDIIEQFLKLSTAKIVVNGYVQNDINKVIELEVLGEKGNAKSQIAGNEVVSGKYVILSVIDKIIGNKMIQLIHIGRSDTGKVSN